MYLQMVHSRSYAPLAFSLGKTRSAASCGSSGPRSLDFSDDFFPPRPPAIASRRSSSAPAAAAAFAASFLGVYLRERTTPAATSASRAARSSATVRLRSPRSHFAVSGPVGASAAATHSSSSWHSTLGLR